jgi:hypothetical protein
VVFVAGNQKDGVVIAIGSNCVPGDLSAFGDVNALDDGEVPGVHGEFVEVEENAFFPEETV